MADLKISEMTPAAELTGAELIECVQGGVNVKQELTGLKTWVNDGVQPFSSTLDALSSFNTNGIMVQTDTSEFIGRTIEGTTSQIVVSNGDGVDGNPVVSLAESGITADTYGSSTEIPVITYTAQGIAISVVNTAITFPTQYSDATFRIQDNTDTTKQLEFEVSGIATGNTKTWTVPNAAINFGDLPAIATTNSNNLSGTRTQILGGSSNTVSGTDNIAIECTGLSLNDDVACSNIVAVGVHNPLNLEGSWPFPKSTVVLGSSTAPNTILVDSLFGAALGGETCLYTGSVIVSATVTNITAAGDVAASNSNSLKAVAGTTAHGAATHDIEFMIAVGTDNGYGAVVVRRTVFERRKVYVCRDQSGTMTSSTITPETAVTLGDAATGTVTVGVTVDTTNNRIVPTVTGVSGANQTYYQASVRVKSHYNRK